MQHMYTYIHLHRYSKYGKMLIIRSSGGCIQGFLYFLVMLAYFHNKKLEVGKNISLSPSYRRKRTINNDNYTH